MAEGLPPEIWLHIISCTIATSPYTWEYQFFNSPEDELERERERRTILSSIVLVCRVWRAFAERIVYEDIDIDCGAITPALEIDDRRGAYVRRAVLSYQSTQTTTARPLDPAILLRRLPNLEILQRRAPRPEEPQNYEFEAEGVSLPSLKRLDWWNMPDTTQSSGINSLHDVLQNAPHIQYLTLGGNYGRINPGFTANLPELTTLRIQPTDLSCTQLIQFGNWSMPALRHFIYTRSPRMPNIVMFVILLDKFGAQLRTLELARSLHSLDADYLVPALRRCHALQEIGYSVNMMLPPRHNSMMGAVNDSVRVVRLQGTLALANLEVNWGDLEAHLRFLAGPALPALQIVVLYPSHGIWDEIMGDPRFAPLGRALRGRGCVLQRADGEPVLVFDLSTSS